MKNFLLTILIGLPFIGSAQVTNPEKVIATTQAGFTATASSANAEGLAASAVDGDVGTFWTSDWGTDADFPHWLQIDMHSSLTITGIYLTARNRTQIDGNIQECTIETSTDGATWQQQGGTINPKSRDDIKGKQYIEFPAPVTCTQYRINITNNYGTFTGSYVNPATDLAETGAITGITTPDPTAYDRTTWVATASSSNDGEGPVKNAIDNDPNTFWTTAWGQVNDFTHSYYQVDMGTVQQVNRISYQQRGNGTNGGLNSRITEGYISYGNDLADTTTWATVPVTTWEYATASTDTNHFINLPNGLSFRYFRVNITQNYAVMTGGPTQDKTSTIAELRAHYDETALTLGTAGDFVLFTASGAVTNTGNSFITGDVGTNTGAITGFGNVNGVMHTSDGATGSATADLLSAYNQLNSATPTNNHAPSLGTETLTAGVYAIAGDATLDGNLTLDAQGNPDAVFIFKIDGTFGTTVASQITLINGAMSCNVFWKVEGAVSVGSQTIMRGTVIANNAAIDLATDVVVDGRILSTSGAITLLNSSAKIPTGCGSKVLTGPAAPDLVSVGCYAIFSTTGEVTNSGITTVKGDVGTNSGVTTGFDPLKVNGMIHPIPDPSTAAAAGDLGNVYTDLNALPYDIELLFPAQFGNDLVLTPHTYRLNGATSLTGTVFLNGEGNADAVFVIQIKGALSTGTFAKVILTNGTQAKNVYWNVDGAVSIADNSEFKGTVIANNGAIDLATGVNLEGRILSTTGLVTTNAVTVTSDKVCEVAPVTWLYFRGKTVQQKVLLEWATTNEVNNNYFTIEKSKDARTFSELTKVKSAINGNTGDHSYTFTDEQPFASTFYRISQTDIDGNQKWYNTINIKIDKNHSFMAKHYIQGNTIYIQTTGAASGNGSIELFSMDGKKIVSQQIRLSADNNTYQINQPLNKGIYILVIKSQNENIYSDKIMVQ